MVLGILEFLGGLGVFLFGISYLEQAVSMFSKGGFKKLLKKFTSNSFSSFLTGIVSTVIVQSSNLISVLVLAFVGTGILSLTGGLAVMLGSNIGTTIPEALFGTIGLKYDIQLLTFPLLFLGAIGITFFSRYEKLVMISQAIIGLALIFLSFSFMEHGLSFITALVDLSTLSSMSSRIFLLIGLVLTLLVQSGGAIFIVTLTSVNSGLIAPETAFPIILGSYLGATITIVMGALGNQPAIKKQVAMGHVGFNAIVALLGMLFLGGITALFSSFIFPVVGIVTGLSIFYVGCRTLVALIVFPFVGVVAHIFQKMITDTQQDFPLSIQKLQTLPIDTELAILALKQDLLVYFKETISHNLHIWDFYLTDITQESDIENLLQRGEYFGTTSLKKEYQAIKLLQEKLLSFLAITNQRVLQKAEEAELTALYQTIIDIGDSAKYLKDVGERVEDWQWSTSVDLQKDYEMLRKMVLDFYKSVLQVLANLDNRQAFSLLHEVVERIKKNDKKYLTIFKRKEGDDVDLANLIQVNRYFSASCLSLVRAIEGISLSVEEKKYVKEHLRELF